MKKYKVIFVTSKGNKVSREFNFLYQARKYLKTIFERKIDCKKWESIIGTYDKDKADITIFEKDGEKDFYFYIAI